MAGGASHSKAHLSILAENYHLQASSTSKSQKHNDYGGLSGFPTKTPVAAIPRGSVFNRRALHFMLSRPMCHGTRLENAITEGRPVFLALARYGLISFVQHMGPWHGGVSNWRICRNIWKILGWNNRGDGRSGLCNPV